MLWLEFLNLSGKVKDVTISLYGSQCLCLCFLLVIPCLLSSHPSDHLRERSQVSTRAPKTSLTDSLTEKVTFWAVWTKVKRNRSSTSKFHQKSQLSKSKLFKMQWWRRSWCRWLIVVETSTPGGTMFQSFSQARHCFHKGSPIFVLKFNLKFSSDSGVFHWSLFILLFLAHLCLF